MVFITPLGCRFSSIYTSTRAEGGLLHNSATHCNTLRMQHIATHCWCNTLQHTADLPRCMEANLVQHTATHCGCNTLQHTTDATHCNTLQICLHLWRCARAEGGLPYNRAKPLSWPVNKESHHNGVGRGHTPHFQRCGALVGLFYVSIGLFCVFVSLFSMLIGSLTTLWCVCRSLLCVCRSLFCHERITSNAVVRYLVSFVCL